MWINKRNRACVSTSVNKIKEKYETKLFQYYFLINTHVYCHLDYDEHINH